MKIVLVGSEAAPLSKTGGLGDVLGGLPAALAKLGHDVKLITPHYRSVSAVGIRALSTAEPLSVDVGGRKEPFTLSFLSRRRPKVETLLVGSSRYFDRDRLYVDPTTGKDYDDNAERFIFFCRAALVAVKALGWKPDIIHAHDWQAALIPVFLKTTHANDSFFADVKSALTIHNLAYQGQFEADTYPLLDLPDELFYAGAPMEFYEKVNFLKGGIVFADKITTVSKTYAGEIQLDNEQGCGLHGDLRKRSDDLCGIINGVDYTVWSPSRDKKILFNYHVANLSGKRANKVELLGAAGLPVRDSAPLIGMVSRLVDQKGFDLLAEVAEELLKLNVQMIALGTGDEKYHDMFTELQAKYPQKMKAYLTFDDTIAHRIEAASDIFLMPSRYEPCGLNQMYSLKYGTVPVVRKVGGLADTVTDFNPNTGEGVGFVFEEYDGDSMMKALRRAVDTFSQKRVWTKLMKAGMSLDYSWNASACRYQRVYQSLLGQ
jgi:starch synthase